MGLFKPDAPTPPNPITTAAAQTGSNVSTAVANAFLNNTNQVTPTGSLTYTPTSTYNWTDPTTSQTYSIPRFTATQELSPVGKQLQGLDQATQLNLANMAVGQSDQLRQLLGVPFNAQTGSFNGAAYMSANPDVAASYAAGHRPGETQEQYAARHYQESGQFEGRPGAFGAAPVAGQAANVAGVPGAVSSFTDTGQQQGALPFTGQQQSTFGDAGDITRGFGDAGDITRSYGPGDFSADRANVEQSLYQRMDPQLQRDRSNLEARLADQGIQIGSPAYQAAWDQFNRQLTDTRLGITQTAGQEQQRMMDMAAQRAGFENAAQQQAYQQAQGRGAFANAAQMQAYQQAQARGEFANAAQAQNYGQALQTGQFANAAQQQNFAQAQARANFYNTAQAQNLAQAQSVFNAQNTQRGQYLSEAYQQRNQPINEITSLLSGAQVQNPNFVNTPNNQIPTTDIAGIINNRFNQDMSIYQQQNNNFNQLMGGIFGAMGGMIRPSDRDVKENIHRVGTVFAASTDDEPSKLPIYRYSYKGDPASVRHIGPMAQDVEKVDPDAVREIGGVKHIDTSRVMGSILRAA